MPKPTTFDELIDTHREMLERLAYDEMATKPAEFICQLGELVDLYASSPTTASAAESLSRASTCLAEALDQPESSPTRAEYLQAANRHLWDVAAHALA